MSIDAIGSVVAGVSALAASRTELAAGNKGTNGGQSSTADQVVNDQTDATVVAISQEAQAQQQAALDQAAEDAAAAASASADPAVNVSTNLSTVTGAIGSDWASGAPAVDNPAVQEALEALDEASRENNIQVQQDAIKAQQAQTAFDQQTIDDAATATLQREDDIVLAAINAGIRVAFGALSTPITGDPALREPGKVDIVA